MNTSSCEFEVSTEPGQLQTAADEDHKRKLVFIRAVSAAIRVIRDSRYELYGTAESYSRRDATWPDAG